jgi:hypothetical protein
MNISGGFNRVYNGYRACKQYVLFRGVILRTNISIIALADDKIKYFSAFELFFGGVAIT